MSKPGGLGNAKPIDADAAEIANRVKADVEAKAGKTFSHYNPTQYATQVGGQLDTVTNNLNVN